MMLLDYKMTIVSIEVALRMLKTHEAINCTLSFEAQSMLGIESYHASISLETQKNIYTREIYLSLVA